MLVKFSKLTIPAAGFCFLLRLCLGFHPAGSQDPDEQEIYVQVARFGRFSFHLDIEIDKILLTLQLILNNEHQQNKQLVVDIKLWIDKKWSRKRRLQFFRILILDVE